MIEACFAELRPILGTAGACRASGKVPGHPLPALRRPAGLGPSRAPPGAGNALSATRRPPSCWPCCARPGSSTWRPPRCGRSLLDEGRYLASISTMYRVLRAGGEVREREPQATHPTRARPELMADRPNMCWSWDITKLRGPDKGVWFDLLRRSSTSSPATSWAGWSPPPRPPSWPRSSSPRRSPPQGITAGQLTIHADRGTSMTSKGVAELLADLGVGRTHSRPHVSNDNPYSARRPSRPSSTARRSPPGSAPSRTPARSARVLRLLQPSPPPLRHRPAHPRIGPLRHRHRDPSPAGRDPRRRLRRQPPPVLRTDGPPHPSCPPSPGSTTPPSTTTHRRNPENLSQRS